MNTSQESLSVKAGNNLRIYIYRIHPPIVVSPIPDAFCKSGVKNSMIDEIASTYIGEGLQAHIALFRNLPQP